MIPKIINRPEAATTEVPEQMRPVTTGPKAETVSADPSKPKTDAPASKDQPPLPSKNATSGNTDDQTVTVSLLSVVRSPMTGIVALGGLALVMLAAFALARRREHLATTQARDIASVSLQGRGNRGQLVTQPAGNRTPSTPASRPPPPTPQPTARGQAPAWAERIPQTRGEALQMLGMGVSPDATEMAMKKIVDGLRQSWHPDFAKDEADRQLREFRLKQINAAWELIQGKRLERLDS